MNRSEFTGLPLSLALGALWDALDSGRDPASALHDAEAPKPARPPKYDQAIYRREGITWASEYDVEDLRFWRKRKSESASGGGEYAEKDAKQAKALEFWISWREQNPTAVWTGERNREQVTAAAPASKPTVYPRDARGAAPVAPSSSSGGGGGYADEDYGGADGDDIPF